MAKFTDRMQKNIDPYIEAGKDVPLSIFCQMLFIGACRGGMNVLKIIGVVCAIVLFALSGGR